MRRRFIMKIPTDVNYGWFSGVVGNPVTSDSGSAWTPAGSTGQPQATGYSAAGPVYPGYPAVGPSYPGYPTGAPGPPGYPAGGPNNSGYPVVAPGYPPVGPPNPGYPSAGPGYPPVGPSNPGYPSTGPGYPPVGPPNPGYPSTGSGYPPVGPPNPGYLSAGPGYPPVGPGYPPVGPGYSSAGPANPGYPASGPGYPPGGPNYQSALDEKTGIADVQPQVPVTPQDEQQVRKLQETFQRVAGEDMEIDAHELRDVLNAAFMREFKFDGFSMETCRSMVAMMDVDQSGKLGFDEFQKLWKDLRVWKSVFKQFDNDMSGTLNSYELRSALNNVGMKVSNQTFNALVMRFADKHGAIFFDDFILCAVRLRTMFDTFLSLDPNKSGSATFTLDQFIQTTMYS